MSSDTRIPDDEVRRVLEMVAAGTITPEAAALLLDALAPAAPPVPPAAAPTSRPVGGLRHARTARTYRVEAPVEQPASSREARRELSREVRRFSREAKRAAHEAKKVAKREMKDAMREAEDEIKRAFRLSVGETRRALADVAVELRSAFAGGLAPVTDSAWLTNLASLGIARDQVSHVARTVTGEPAAQGDKLTVRNFAGDVQIAGWDEQRVEVRAERTGWGVDAEMAQDRAESMPLDVHRAPGEIVIEAQPPVPSGIGLLNLRRMTTVLTVMVPRDLPVNVTTKSGDVTATGFGGPLTVTSMQGDLVVDAASGDLAVETVTGDISLRDCTSPIAALTTVSGNVVANLTPQAGGQYRMRSADGDVSAAITPGADLECAMETVSGSLQAGPNVAIRARQAGMLRGLIGRGPGLPAVQPATLTIVTITGDASVA